MLSSITPLGERGRHSRWGVTAVAFLLGNVLGGAAAGLAAGAIGAAVLPAAGAGSVVAIAGALALGLALELRIAGLSLPTVRRQVDEAWLRRYRGWVYGVGFGVQLGAGMVTIVVSSAVYVTFIAAAVSASPLTGLALGACFGALRGLTLLPAAWVGDTRRLLRLHRGMIALRRPSWRAAIAGQLVLIALATALAVL